MDKGYVYTLIFMVLVSIILTSILAVSNAAFLPTIEDNAWMAQQEAILDAFGIEVEDPETFFNTNVVAKNFGIVDGFELTQGDGAYALPFEGAGLWGTIRGYVAMDKDLDEMLGITFTEQSETPGLGGRIEEAQYRDQFRHIELGHLKYEGDLQAITGATQTSDSVLRIINNFLDNILPKLEVN